MNIKTQLHSINPSQATVSIEVSKNDVNLIFNHVYKKLSKQVKIPGFRSGKVPKNILNTRFSHNIKTQAFEQIITSALQQFLSSQKIQTLSPPEIENFNETFLSIQENQPFFFKSKLELYPTVKLAPYTRLNISIPNYVYQNKHVLHELLKLQEQKTQIIKKQNNPSVKPNDVLQIQYNVYLVFQNQHNNKIEYLDLQPKKNWLQIPKQELLGLKIGYQKIIPLNPIPHDYENDQLAGKNGHVWIKILNIFQKIVPTIDDHFAKQFNFQNLHNLKQDIQLNLDQLCYQKKRMDILDFIMNILIQQSEFQISPHFIQKQVKQKNHWINQQLKKQNSSSEKYIKKIKKSSEQFQDEIQKSAINDIKYQLVLNELFQKQNIQINNQQLELKFKEYIQKNKIQTKTLDKNQINDLKENFKHNQKKDLLIDFLIDQNTIQTREIQNIF